MDKAEMRSGTEPDPDHRRPGCTFLIGERGTSLRKNFGIIRKSVDKRSLPARITAGFQERPRTVKMPRDLQYEYWQRRKERMAAERLQELDSRIRSTKINRYLIQCLDCHRRAWQQATDCICGGRTEVVVDNKEPRTFGPYQGVSGVAKYSHEEDCWNGLARCEDDVLTFVSFDGSGSGLEREFQKAVEDYLTCKRILA